MSKQPTPDWEQRPHPYDDPTFAALTTPERCAEVTAILHDIGAVDVSELLEQDRSRQRDR